ncbi:hypothetical protein JCM10450v2_006011 [Rhodotorula kratochvilovae]
MFSWNECIALDAFLDLLFDAPGRAPSPTKQRYYDSPRSRYTSDLTRSPTKQTAHTDFFASQDALQRGRAVQARIVELLSLAGLLVPPRDTCTLRAELVDAVTLARNTPSGKAYLVPGLVASPNADLAEGYAARGWSDAIRFANFKPVLLEVAVATSTKAESEAAAEEALCTLRVVDIHSSSRPCEPDDRERCKLGLYVYFLRRTLAATLAALHLQLSHEATIWRYSGCYAAGCAAVGCYLNAGDGEAGVSMERVWKEE